MEGDTKATQQSSNNTLKIANSATADNSQATHASRKETTLSSNSHKSAGIHSRNIHHTTGPKKSARQDDKKKTDGLLDRLSNLLSKNNNGKKIILASVVILVVAITASLLVYKISITQQTTTNDTEQPRVISEEEYNQRLDSVYASAEETYKESGIDQVIKNYDNEINNISYSAEQKAAIHLNRAQLLIELQSKYGENVQEQILSDAYAAESLNPTARTAQVVYIAETISGADEKAEEFLQLMYDRSSNNKLENGGGRE